MAQAVMPPKSSLIEPPRRSAHCHRPSRISNLRQCLSVCLEAENTRLQAVTDHLRASTALLEDSRRSQALRSASAPLRPLPYSY